MSHAVANDDDDDDAAERDRHGKAVGRSRGNRRLRTRGGGGGCPLGAARGRHPKKLTNDAAEEWFADGPRVADWPTGPSPRHPSHTRRRAARTCTHTRTHASPVRASVRPSVLRRRHGAFFIFFLSFFPFFGVFSRFFCCFCPVFFQWSRESSNRERKIRRPIRRASLFRYRRARPKGIFSVLCSTRYLSYYYARYLRRAFRGPIFLPLANVGDVFR